jgi:hypothetical protein
MPITDQVFCSVEEAKRITTLGRTKLYYLARDGVIESRKVGRRRLFVVASLMELGK